MLLSPVRMTHPQHRSEHSHLPKTDCSSLRSCPESQLRRVALPFGIRAQPMLLVRCLFHQWDAMTMSDFTHKSAPMWRCSRRFQKVQGRPRSTARRSCQVSPQRVTPTPHGRSCFSKPIYITSTQAHMQNHTHPQVLTGTPVPHQGCNLSDGPGLPGGM